MILTYADPGTSAESWMTVHELADLLLYWRVVRLIYAMPESGMAEVLEALRDIQEFYRST